MSKGLTVYSNQDKIVYVNNINNSNYILEH